MHRAFVPLFIVYLTSCLAHPARFNNAQFVAGNASTLSRRINIAEECSYLQREILYEIQSEASQWSHHAQTDSVPFFPPRRGLSLWEWRSIRGEIFRAYFGFLPTLRPLTLSDVQQDFKTSLDRRFSMVENELSLFEEGRIMIRCDQGGNLGCREGDWSVMSISPGMRHLWETEGSLGRVDRIPYPDQIVVCRPFFRDLRFLPRRHHEKSQVSHMVRVMLSSIVGVDESRDGDTIHLGESHDYRFSAPWEFYPPDYEHVPSSGPPLGSYEDYVTDMYIAGLIPRRPPGFQFPGVYSSSEGTASSAFRGTSEGAASSNMNGDNAYQDDGSGLRSYPVGEGNISPPSSDSDSNGAPHHALDSYPILEEDLGSEEGDEHWAF